MMIGIQIAQGLMDWREDEAGEGADMVACFGRRGGSVYTLGTADVE